MKTINYPKGESHYNAKLTADDVKQIRQNRYGMTDAQQAAKYGVHPNTIFRVRNREAWGHV